jgi:choline-sulfatase
MADVQRALAGYFGLVSLLDEHIGKIMATLSDLGLNDSTDILYTSDHGDNLGARGLWGKSTMYEEIAGVPFIAAGPSFPAGLVVDTPVSHVDAFPTIVESAGQDFAQLKNDHPGINLCEIAKGIKPVRTVLSEYHGMGSTTGAYMIRVGQYKYVHYVKYPAQLFDLLSDPEEMTDVADRPEMASVLTECRQKLYALLDPVAVDAQAKKRQSELLATHGGREAVIARGDLGFTPAPGTAAAFA